MEARRQPWSVKNEPLIGGLAIAAIMVAIFSATGWWLAGAEERTETARQETGRRIVRPARAQMVALRSAFGAGPAAAVGAIQEDPDEPAAAAILPLDALSSEAADYAAGLPCCVSIAVVVPEEGLAYEFEGDVTSPLLSVAKVPIMTMVLGQAIEDGRELTATESELLSLMIQSSDNEAAYSLWYAMGGAEAMVALFESVGLGSITTYADSWGSTLASPLQMASLLAMIVQGDVLDEAARMTAMDVLSAVDPSQAWGALSGTEGLVTETGVKNGWYPEPSGWSLNSLAYVAPDDGAAYTMAIFTQGSAIMSDGIATIEEIARAINEQMLLRF
ncbi:MAG: serine hydrolase [Chloroflexi bacterium]|nr:serine hydrolase [Chloroflexota bacterium]MCI0814114.1 serine hydrolase [Chloroflexota bacterium]MCI0816892.1 serine hydrolase [Chloroflexota bacterium]MCI0839023.1 serine hydrolase [Chloroflexota bacterium]